MHVVEIDFLYLLKALVIEYLQAYRRVDTFYQRNSFNSFVCFRRYFKRLVIWLSVIHN